MMVKIVLGFGEKKLMNVVASLLTDNLDYIQWHRAAKILKPETNMFPQSSNLPCIPCIDKRFHRKNSQNSKIPQ